MAQDVSGIEAPTSVEDALLRAERLESYYKAERQIWDERARRAANEHVDKWMENRELRRALRELRNTIDVVVEKFDKEP
jgi:hypothetical protein